MFCVLFLVAAVASVYQILLFLTLTEFLRTVRLFGCCRWKYAT